MNKLLKNVVSKQQVNRYTLVLCCCMLQNSFAEPTGGTIVGGQGSIDFQGASTTINQSTDRLAIDWQTFNVAEDESVQFIQPGRDAIALNRILDQNPSQIFGRIDANGNVILLNARGVLFGRSASVNVGGLVASTLDVNPTEFINSESFTFSAVPGTDGIVVNQGLIEAATGGSVSLLGKSVSNEGVILAKLGKVNLAAGSEAVLTFDTDGLIGVSVTKEVMENDIGVDVAALNEGVIDAEGGQVIMSAKVSKDLFSNAVNNTGIVRATSVQAKNGSIYLTAQGGDIANSGMLDVSADQQGMDGGSIVVKGDNIQQSGIINANAAQGDGGSVELNSKDMTLLTGNSVTSAKSESNGTGGMVSVLGDKVGLFDTSLLDVSGAKGGGTALVGGDYQGNNPLVKNASRTFVSDNSEINADAGEEGNGGKVIVWADEITKFYGDIFARGGRLFGNGGFAEVSGKQWLDFDGYVDLAADVGENGSLLLDPDRITIATTAPNNIDAPAPDSNGISIAFSDFNNDITVNVTSINNILGAGTSLELQALTDIIVNAAIDVPVGTTTPGGDLTLRANDDIRVNASISLNQGDLLLFADNNNAGGVGEVEISNVINTNGGNFQASGDTIFDNSNGYVDTNGGDAVFDFSGNITLNDANNDFSTVDVVNATGLVLSDANSITLRNIFTTNHITVDAAQDINVTGTVNGNNNLNLNLSSGILGSTSTVTLNLDSINRNIAITGGTGNTSLEVQVQDTGVIPTIDWTIDQANRGNFNGNGFTRSFTSVENLTGGAQQDNFAINASLSGDVSGGLGDDSFIFGANGGIGGILDGGSGNNDTADYSAITNNNNPVTVDLNNVIGIETLTGSNDILIGADFENNWDFAAGGTSVTNTNDNVTTTFTGFNDITGGSVVDTFVMDVDFTGALSGGDGGDTFRLNVSNTGIIDGGADSDTFIVADGVTLASINGGTSTADNDYLDLTAYSTDTNWVMDPLGNNQITDTNVTPNLLISFSGMESFAAGSGIDTLNYNNFTSDISVNLAGAVNFESIVGGQGTNDTLTGNDNNNTWSITEQNGGCVANVAFPVDCAAAPGVFFSGFENLTGGTGNDSFEFENAFNIDGILDGGDGLDEADYSRHQTSLVLDLMNVVNVETLIGGAGADTLIGRDDTTLNTWIITGPVLTDPPNTPISGEVNSTQFSGFENLTGGDVSDEFVFNDGVDLNLINFINGGNGTDTVNYSDFTSGVTIDLLALYNRSIEEVIGSGTGSDSVSAGNGENTWTITDQNQGNVSVAGIGTSFSFYDISNISGGTGIDRFEFDNDAAEITGTINGGLGAGANTLDYSGVSASVDVTVDRSTPSNSTAVGGFSNIQEFVGGSGSNDTIVGDAGGETWDITGSNSGTVANTTFSGFENITGGSGNDIFQFHDNGSLFGALDGNDGDDRLDYRLVTSNGNAVTVNLDSLIRMEQVYGTDFNIVGQNDTFQGSVNLDNNWNISSANSGEVNGIAFFGFENLSGGNLDDYFNFSNTASVAGTVDGGSNQGTNRLNYASVSSNITVDLGQNTASLTGGIDNINDVTGGLGVNDTLVGGNATDNNWNITGSNTGNIDNAFAFRSMENLTGGDLDDTFNMEQGGVINGTLNGGGGSNNTLDYRQRTTQVTVDLNGPSATDVDTFTNIQTIIGGQTDDTFHAADGITNNWTITGSDSGSVAGIQFQSFEILQGGDDGSDVFTFNDGVSFIGTIDGGIGAANTLDYSNYVTSGVTINLASLINFSDIVGSSLEDTIIGHNAVNTWAVSDADQGSLSNIFGTFTFSAIENLTGGNNTDNFFIQSNAAATGSIRSINGGQGINSLNYSNYDNSAVTVDLSQNTATGVAQFSSIASVTGSAQSDTLIADNATDNNWNINQTNGGTLNNQFGFSGIENLTGSTSDDTFNFSGDAFVVGTINGGGGSGVDTLDYSAANSEVTVDLANNTATSTGGIINIENLIGRVTGGDTLIGPDGFNTWNVSGLTSGNVNSFTFSNVDIITGGSARDVFNVSATGNIPEINGGAGNDEFNIIYSTASRSITFDGGLDTDTVNFTGNAPLSNTVVTMSDTNPNGLETTNGNQTVTLNGIEQFNDLIIGSAISIFGPDSGNDIQIGAGTLNGSNPTSVVFNGFVPMEFSGKEIVVIRGGQGTDAITVNSDFTVPTRLILSAETLNAGTFTLTSNVLVLSGFNTIGSASQYLLTDVSQLQLIGTGDTYILETDNGVDLLQSDVNGNLYLAALAGNISSSRRLSVTGNASFTATSGASISLTDANNTFMGELEFTTFDPLAGVLGNVQLVNNSGVLLANVDTTDLSITAAGDITDVDQTGELTAGGTVNLDASGNNVILDNANHDFGVVNANNVAQLVLSDQNNVGIGTIVAGDVSINAGGAVLNSNTGATNVTADSLAITAAGGIGANAALSTDVATVSLANTQSGNINLNNQGNLTIASIDNSANSGNIAVASGGTITQTGDVTGTNNIGLDAADNYLQQADINAENNVNVSATGGVITMQDGTRTDSNGATINYSANGTVTVSSLDAVYAQGGVEITSDTGSIISSRAPDLSRPNVTGNFALFNAEFGSLGEPGRPLVINVPGRVIINTFTSVAPIYLVPPGEVIDTSRLLFNINETKSVLGDSQRTEVDELAVIDPAVFTQVKNYTEDQYPVKLPRDQLYTADEEEKDKKAEDPDLFEVEEAGQNTGL